MWALWLVVALIVLLGVPFTLWWWRKADQWADAEHRRFKPRPETRERVVVRSENQSSPTPTEPPARAGRSEQGPGGADSPAPVASRFATNQS